jgi:GT2 family glycosyltransferase
MTPQISVAVLSWNGREHLEVCLPALRGQLDPGVRWEALVLDNGSSDGTAAWIAEAHPWVRVERSEANVGFCAGYNRLAGAASGEFLALLNNDTQPREDWLKNLTAAMRHAAGDVAAVGGMILDWTGEKLDFAGGVLTFDGHALQRGFGLPLQRAAALLPPAGAELLFGCGGNLIVRRQSFLDAGGFDPAYFAYYEDVDLGWRLWAGGERVLFEPSAVVHHRSNASSDRLGPFNRGFLFERNAFLTAYKNLDEAWWPRLMPAIQLTYLSRTQTLLEQNNRGGEQAAIDPYAGASADAGTAARGARRRRWFSRRLAAGVDLSDPRALAQFRASRSLLRHLDSAAETRRLTQARRRRADRDIFERFGLYVIPTYPGDEALFASAGFAAWLPGELPLRRATLREIAGTGD